MPSWKKVITSGSNAALNTLNVTTAFTASGLNYPTADNGEESFLQTNGSGNLSFQYVKTIYEEVYNGEDTSINKGTPLYVSGSVGAASVVYRADASIPSKMPVIYVAADNIASGDTGRGIVLGLITGVDTTGYPAGTEIFVAPGGGWTSTRPTGSNIVQLLGIITKEGAGGQGVVLNPGPYNNPNIQPGHLWVGNNDSQPTPVTTSSLSVFSAISSSFATTASYVNGNIFTNDNLATSASFAVSASRAVSASFSTTSSYALNALSASFSTSSSLAQNANNGFPFTGSAGISGSLTVRGTTSSDSPPLGNELLTSTGWTSTGWTGDFTSGFTHTIGNTNVLSNTLPAVIGTYYFIVWTTTGRTAGSAVVSFGGTSFTISGNSALSNTGPLATTTVNLTITPTSDFDGNIVLSIKTIGTSVPISSFTTSDGGGRIEIRTNTNNTFIGSFAGRRNISLNNNGIQNTFIGNSAGQNNTTGRFNTFIGFPSGQNNTTGNSNTFLGSSAGAANTTGGSNTFLGQSAGLANTTGIENTFLGQNAGLANTTGNANTFIGRESGLSNTTGGTNSTLGWNALRFQTTGGANIAIGYNAGRVIANGLTSLTIANSSIFIGQNTKALADNQTNQIVIGHNSTGLGSNTTVIGTTSTLSTAIYGDLLLGTTVDNGVDILQVVGSTRLNGNTVITGSLTITGSFNIISSSYQYQQNLTATTTSTISTIPTGSFRSAFFDYVAVNNSLGTRAGTVLTAWSGSSVEFVDTSTNDIGNTTPLTLSASLSGGNILLQSVATTGSWSIKTLARLL